jgi:thioester reductase-like protein
MTSNGGDILLTGATGFVGMEVLARLLERDDRRIVALVRARSDDAAGARVDDVLVNLLGERARGYRRRVEAVAADLTAERLGLPARRYDALAGRVNTIVHSAASVSFTLPLPEARAVNLEGTRRMLELAQRASDAGGLERYAHVSTAYVAGTHEGRFAECDLDVGQGFRNSYEQSKFEAETLVRARTDLPCTVLRPSIVVGDRRSGWTSAFNVLYWPLRALSRGLFTAVPALPSALVDVVSVDFVADAIHALCQRPDTIGETYHLTAGAHATTIGELAHLASRYFRRPLPKLITPAEYEALARAGGRARAALASGQAYFPYVTVQTVFDEGRARSRLGPAGIQASPLRDYLERLLDFATRSRWGKTPIGRAEALAR